MEKRVMVVNGDARKAVELCKKMRELGHRATACVSSAALSGLNQEPWDLVVTDWDFYHLKGAVLLEALKPWNRPVFVLSARDTLGIAAEAIESGARGAWSYKTLNSLLEEAQRLLMPQGAEESLLP